MRHTKTLASVAMLMLAGCSQTRSSDLFGVSGAGSAPPAGEAARVFAGRCIPGPGEPIAPAAAAAAAPLVAPVLAALAGTLVKEGLSTVGKALVAAGEEQTFSIGSLGATPSLAALWTANAANSCIQFVLGQFPDGSVDRSALQAGAVAERDGDAPGVRARLAASGILLRASPRLFLEYRIVSADSAVQRPRMVHLVETNRHNDGFLGSGGSSRELAVAILINAADAKISDASPLQVPPETLPRRSARSFGASSPGAPTTQWLPLSEDLLNKPLNVMVIAAETRNANQFLTVLGTALQDSSVTSAAATAASTAVTRAVDPAARQDAAIAGQNRARTQFEEALALATEARTAIADARACTEACPDKIANARFLANLATARFRTLHLPQPPFDLTGL